MPEYATPETRHAAPEATPAADAGPDRAQADPGNAALLEEIALASQADGDDNYIRDTIHAPHLAVATAAQKAGMIVNLLDGPTEDDDEGKILEILESPRGAATFAAIEAMGHLEWLFEDVNGEEHDRLLERFGPYADDKATAAERAAAEAAAPKKEEPVAQVEPREGVAPLEAAEPQEAAEAAPVAADGPITDPDDPRLSDDRKKMLDEADKRMGSYRNAGLPTRANGEKGVNLFDGTEAVSKGSSCGLLPGVLLQKLGVRDNAKTLDFGGAMVGGVEELGKELGVWEVSTGQNAPTPGDVYILRTGTADNGSVQHVGVVNKVGPEAWITADAGQGGDNLAAYLTRTLVTPKGIEEAGLEPGTYFAADESSPDTAGGAKRVAGWVNLDALMAVVRG